MSDKVRKKNHTRTHSKTQENLFSRVLSSVSIGLRGFRARPLLHRLWDGVTGQGQELQAAIGSDIFTVQQATLRLVHEIMSEEMRTQYCVERVLHNLTDVNKDLDDLIKHLTFLEEAVKQLQTRHQLLEIKLQLESLFRTGDLHPGAGNILGSALYLAQIERLYTCLPELVQEERRVALSIIRKQLDSDKPEVLTALFAQVVEQISSDSLEVVAFLVSDRPRPILRVLSLLVERRIVGLRTDVQISEETIKLVRRFRDPDGQLRKK